MATPPGRYSPKAIAEYTSYPKRIFKGGAYHTAVKIGAMKWRVLPNNKDPEGRNKYEGYIVTATKFPPNTKDFGKLCFPRDKRVENREIKCTCADATAKEGYRNWTQSQAGLFYPCKHIIAVLLKEKIDFIADTLANYKRDRQTDCTPQPSPPDTKGIVIRYHTYLSEIIRSGSTNYFLSYWGERTLDYTNLVVNPTTKNLEYNFEFSTGQVTYTDGTPTASPYTLRGNGLGNPYAGTNTYTITEGPPGITTVAMNVFGGNDPRTFKNTFGSWAPFWKRSDLDFLISEYSNPNNKISQEIIGDTVFTEYYLAKFQIGGTITNDPTGIIILKFIPVPGVT